MGFQGWVWSGRGGTVNSNTEGVARVIENRRSKIENSSRLALLMHEYLASGYGKMGHGLLRYSEAEIVAVVDRANVGKDLKAVTGIARSAPIVASVAEAAVVCS